MTDILVPRWVTTPSGLHVGLESWVGDNPFGEPLLRLIWDSFDHYQALLDAGFDQKEITRVREAFLKNWEMHGRFGDTADLPFSIFVAVWAREQVMENILKMTRTVIENISHIGGDDGFFDYYPDEFSMYEQMVFNIKESAILMPEDLDRMLSHFQMAKAMAFCMRYSDREHWELINASDQEYETMQKWLRRKWVVELSRVDQSVYSVYGFTKAFWGHIGIAPVKELTA